MVRAFAHGALFRRIDPSFHKLSHYLIFNTCLLMVSFAYLHGKSVCLWCGGSSDRSSMVDRLSYFLFQPVLHDWCNKCCGMCYPVCVMVHIKEPLLLIGKSSPCGGSGFPLSLSVVLYHMSDAI